ncbi:MAG: hypothetical protein LBN08_01300 [Lactobacillales bacterium]|jgi:hypothetical protein|nr:hypothetical protein [Lactobacillales bacterium]
MVKISFEEKVLQKIILGAKIYQEYFVEKEYLIVADKFKNRHYEIDAKESNFLHLTGVKSKLRPVDFFLKQLTKS